MKKHALITVIVVIGARSISQAIARRVSVGKHVLLADLRKAGAGRIVTANTVLHPSNGLQVAQLLAAAVS